MTAFRAVWPILDETIPYDVLRAEAKRDLPRLAAQAHARIAGIGQYVIAPSDMVPGSGRITRLCLVYTGPAVPIARPAFSTLGRSRTYDTPDHAACGRCGIVRRINRRADNPGAELCVDCRWVEAS